MKKLLLIPFLLMGTATLVLAQAPTATAENINPNGPKMVFDQMTHEFGKITQGESVSYEFKFKNTGKEPLIITSASGSCGCTVPDWPKDPIKPGGSASIKVTFNSAGKMGGQDKTVTIVSNSTEGTLVLHMKGTVEAKPVDATMPNNGADSKTGGSTAATPVPAPATKEPAKTSTDAKTTPKAAPATVAPKTVDAKATPKAAPATAAKAKPAVKPAPAPAAKTEKSGGNN